MGNVIQINDGTYNATWYIAGFDCEYNRVASDDSTYDNGYGIALVPVRYVTTAIWDVDNRPNGAYLYSDIYNSCITIANNLKTVLGTHLVNRKVLLSNQIDTTYYRSTGYIWTTAYCTLLSGCQITGNKFSYSNEYDDGEANYQLPLFKFKDYMISSYGFWLRGFSSNPYIVLGYNGNSGIKTNTGASLYSGVRPLIYIR